MNTVLTVAGSDSSGGAGIQADLKTMGAMGCFGMSVITALTAQNTTGVQGIYEVTPEFVKLQMDSVFSDIRPKAVKIGMLSSEDIIHAVAEKLREYRAEHIVLDPVMIATSGSRLIENEAVQALKEELFPIAQLITPNLSEAEVLAGMSIKSKEDMLLAAKKLETDYEVAVLIKGGHLLESADDILCSHGKEIWFTQKRLENENTHGTGCTLSSAIACGLAAGKKLPDSIAAAKDYITGAIEAGLNLGSGHGPLNHFYLR